MAHPLRFAALEEDSLERAAVLAARAFADSPPYVHAFGRGSTEAFRERALALLFGKTFALRVPHGCCHCMYDDRGGDRGPVCFLMLVGPEVPSPSLAELVRSGYMRSLAVLGICRMWALAQFTAWVEGVEAELLGGRRAMRLEGMAVEPRCQGRGVGSSALRLALAEADRRGLDVVLATQAPRSVAFYGRLGFEVRHEAVYDPAGFNTWFMLRAPSPQP